MDGKSAKMAFFLAKRQMNINVFNIFFRSIEFGNTKNIAHFFLHQNFIIIKIIIQTKMLPSHFEQFQTLQQYLRCLFDEFPQINLQQLQQNQNSRQQYEPFFHLLTSYGKKLMEMTEQSTYKYRNQHYLVRRDVEEEVYIIYKHFVGQEGREKYQKMIRMIVQKLQDQRKSIWAKYSMPESRIIPTDPKSSQKRQVILEEDRISNVRNSKAKTKVSKVTSVKEALQIKNYFQIQENSLRDLFNIVNRIYETHKIPLSAFEVDETKFNKKLDENNSQKIIEMIKFSTQTHSKNISNISRLIQTLNDNLSKRLKNEGQSQTKLALFMEQTQRLEETYSYTISKLLQSLNWVRSNVHEDPSSCQRQLESLEDLTKRLYDLYPTSQIMQHLSVKNIVVQSTKNYGVQVNINKAVQEKKNGPDIFRLQVKINQCLERFQKGSKFRKTIEIKQIQKLFENIREIIPSKQAKSQTEIAYQQQFKNIMQLHEKKEKQLIQSTSKRIKKIQKKNQQLQVSIQDYKKQLLNVNEQWQKQRRKIQKKFESQQHQLKKISKQKAFLDSNLNQYIHEIQKMREDVRKKGDEQSKLRRSLQNQCEQLREKHSATSRKYKQLAQQLKKERQNIGEQRQIYHKKIEMTEGQLQSERQLSTGLKIELETVINQNHDLKQQLQEMRKIYEIKIHEVDQMIENIRDLQKTKSNQDQTISQLQAKIQKCRIREQNLESNLNQTSIRLNQTINERQQLQRQVQHWKQQGKLTDSDLKMLKDQVQKVNRAYLQSQEQLQATKNELSTCNEQRQKLFRERLRLTRVVEDQQAQIASVKARQQALQLSQRDMKDQYYQASYQLKRLQKESEELKKQSIKMRKDLSQEREEKAKYQKQLRDLRQEQQSKKQAQSLDQGKRRMQLESLRMQLRRKTDQYQKQKQQYQQKLNIAQQKMKELQQLSGQKQLLSRLLQNHQSS